MTRRTGFATVIFAAVALSTLFLALRSAEAFDRDLSLSEYARLKAHLSGAYANLEWIAIERGLDLATLDRETTRAIDEATSAGEVRAALEAFVEAFDDPHFYARKLKPSMFEKLSGGGGASDRKTIDSELPAGRACKLLGYNGRDLGFELQFDDEPGYQAVRSDDANPFHAGVVALDSGRRAGIIRIAHFGEDGYPEVCREVWSTLAPDIDELCADEWCGGFHLQVRNRLLGYLTDRIARLQELGYDVLVVDITGNGGGTDWVHAAAEIVSPRQLACSRSSFVRHPHWTRIVTAIIDDVEADLTREHLPDETRETVERVLANLRELQRQTESPCGASALWQGSVDDADCSNIVEGGSYTCGLVPTLEPGALTGVRDPGLYYSAMKNEYTPHVNEQPLVVLIDGNTASASELFGSVLQDSDAATIVGSRSFGAGCGFVNGGIPLTLEHVGLKVMAPDCVRFRADGTNEIEGIEPDIELNWSTRDSPKSRTAKVLGALGGLEPIGGP